MALLFYRHQFKAGKIKVMDRALLIRPKLKKVGKKTDGTALYEEVRDEKGNVMMENVMDEHGKPKLIIVPVFLKPTQMSIPVRAQVLDKHGKPEKDPQERIKMKVPFVKNWPSAGWIKMNPIEFSDEEYVLDNCPYLKRQ